MLFLLRMNHHNKQKISGFLNLTRINDDAKSPSGNASPRRSVRYASFSVPSGTPRANLAVLVRKKMGLNTPTQKGEESPLAPVRATFVHRINQFYRKNIDGAKGLTDKLIECYHELCAKEKSQRILYQDLADKVGTLNYHRVTFFRNYIRNMNSKH